VEGGGIGSPFEAHRHCRRLFPVLYVLEIEPIADKSDLGSLDRLSVTENGRVHRTVRYDRPVSLAVLPQPPLDIDLPTVLILDNDKGPALVLAGMTKRAQDLATRIGMPEYTRYKEPIVGRALFFVSIVLLTINLLGAAVTVPIWLYQFQNLPMLAMWLAGAGSALILMGVGRMVELLADIRRETAAARDVMERARS